MAKRIREKAAKIEQNRDKRPVAHAKHIRISSSKVRLVADLVRGKSYNEAVAVLENTPNGSAIVILKAIKSAAANAENNQSMNRDDLFVAEIFAAPGPILKRINIRARGRVDRISKRTCHITVRLDSKEDPIGAPKLVREVKVKKVDEAASKVAVKSIVAAKKDSAKTSAKPVAKAAAKPVKEVKKTAAKPAGATKAETAKKTAKVATKTTTKTAGGGKSAAAKKE